MNPLQQLLFAARPTLRSAGAGLVLLMASSCAVPQLRPPAAHADTRPTINADYTVPQEDVQESAARDSQIATPDTGIQQLSHEVPAEGASEVREWPALPPGQVHPFAPPVPDEASPMIACPSPDCYPADPRIALPTESLSLQNCRMPWEQNCEIPVPVCESEVWADEYLCDGCDRGLPVHYHGPEMAGLETEDTVAEFTDHNGEPHVKPSTRVCIYAPQFAAVRSSTLSETDLQVDRAAGAHDGRSMAGLKTQRSARVELQKDQPIGVDVRSRPSGLDTDMAADALAQIASVVNHVKLISLFEDRAFFRRLELDQTQEAYLAYGLQAAVEWTRDLNPVVVASDAAGQEVIAKFKAEEYVGVEDKRTPGCLRILKLADKHTAHPGEVVTFTIHYDNFGQRELTNVRITDNLTPRLQLLKESVVSDRDGRLVVEDNGEGSLVLQFTLAEPLAGESGGTLTFQARIDHVDEAPSAHGSLVAVEWAGDLKITKWADRPAAVRGDLVTFTVQYENISQRVVSSVRISDSITPQLEVLEDSVDSDRDGRLVFQDIGDGRVELTFDLTEPLPSATAGTLTFQARVR